MLDALLNDLWHVQQEIQGRISWIETGKAEKYNEVQPYVEALSEQGRKIVELCERFLQRTEPA